MKITAEEIKSNRQTFETIFEEIRASSRTSQVVTFEYRDHKFKGSVGLTKDADERLESARTELEEEII